MNDNVLVSLIVAVYMAQKIVLEQSVIIMRKRIVGLKLYTK